MSKITRKLLWETMLDEAKKKQKRPDRENKRSLSVQIPEPEYWKLKELAAAKQQGMQEIVQDALNSLFRDNGMLPDDFYKTRRAETLKLPASVRKSSSSTPT